jgi:pimeloyl-ACP methyl ester carboxylesterase
MAVPPLNKRTIVRAAVKVGFGTLELVAPSIAATIVERLWFRIPAGVPLVEPTGRQFAVRWQGHVVRGQMWGDESDVPRPVVYLVHGWGGNGDQMRGFVEPLVTAGYRVVTHDAPSHGRSDAGRHGSRSTDAVEFGHALNAVVAKFGPAHAIVAHSLGTLTVLLALRENWITVERLVLIAPVQGVPAFIAGFRRQLGFGNRTQHRTDRRTQLRTGYRPAELDTVLLARSLVRDLGEPAVLIVQDRKDRAVGTAAAKALIGLWPGAGYVETEGLGHNRVLGDPEVVDRVTQFVRFGKLVDRDSRSA